MAVQPYAGSGTGNQAAVGSINYGWSQNFDPDIEIANHQENVLGKRMIPVPVEADVWDDKENKAKTITTYMMVPAQEDFIDPKTDKVASRDVVQVIGARTAPDKSKASEIMKKYATTAQDSDPAMRKGFVDLQDRLIKAGLLDKKTYNRGVFDDATSNALEKVLISASQMGKSLDDTLDSFAAGNTNPNGTTKSKVTRNIELTNPADVLQSAKNQAPDILGRAADPSIAASLTAQYNAMQANQQNIQYDATDANDGSGGGSMTYNMPSLNTFVEQGLRASDPKSAQGMQLGHYLSEFMSLLHSGGSGSPSTFGGK